MVEVPHAEELNGMTIFCADVGAVLVHRVNSVETHLILKGISGHHKGGIGHPVVVEHILDVRYGSGGSRNRCI